MALDCVIGETIGTQVLPAYNTLRWWGRLQTVGTGDQIRFWGWNKTIDVQSAGCNVVVPQGTHYPSPLKTYPATMRHLLEQQMLP